MPELIPALFDEYASAYARGERPQAPAFLERAGVQADELALLLDGFLAAAAVPEPDEETVAMIGAWLAGDPPLLDLRVRRGVRVDEVVEGLVRGLGLAATGRGKVKRYYQRLEGGLLDPAAVSKRVWAELDRLLGPSATDLAAFRPPPAPAVAFLRAPPASPGEALPSLAVADAASEPEDEIDRLFTSGD